VCASIHSNYNQVAEQGGSADVASRRVHLAAPLTETQLFLVLGGGTQRRKRSSGCASSGSGNSCDGSFFDGAFTVRDTTFVTSGGDGSVRRKRTTSLLALVLAEESLPTPPPEACLAALFKDVQRGGGGGLKSLLGPEKVDRLTQLSRRVALAAAACPDALCNEAKSNRAGERAGDNEAAAPDATAAWPDWSFGALEASAAVWLLPWLAGRTVTSRKELRAAVSVGASVDHAPLLVHVHEQEIYGQPICHRR
jgi:hypothetical protein